jgi:hypothetical protein
MRRRAGQGAEPPPNAIRRVRTVIRPRSAHGPSCIQGCTFAKQRQAYSPCRSTTARDRAEQGREAERARADALRERIDAMQAPLTARQEVIDAAEATRRAEDERRAGGRWAPPA